MAGQLLIGVTEARERIAQLLEEVESKDIVMLRRNRPVALMVHPERVERLVSRIEDLEDHVAALEAKLDPDRIPHEEVVGRVKASA